ncbi:zinc ribbon domain-containing protein [Halobaculum sp. MBLA0143]|uniref:zinc ribbon domain-containing protein n=1 Tax=Halobaculum sp. MBLA0143 TaxID=3079933 RepID=UPI003523F20F
MSREAGEGEVYCVECGNVVSERAEICPDCGVRQPVDTGRGGRGHGGGAAGGAATAGGGRGQAAGGRQGGAATVESRERRGQRQREDVGLIFAHVDAQRRKRLLRNLVDLVLAFSSVGFYLGLMLVEGMRHYYKLKRGHREPFDSERHTKTWFV